MALFYNTTGTGGSENDFFLGANGPNNTYNGGAGHDIILGDAPHFFILGHVPNGAATVSDVASLNAAFSVAFSMDGSGQWSTEADALFGAPSIPHTTLYDVGSGGANSQYYTVTVGAGETLTLDIDGAQNPDFTGFDSLVRLYQSGIVTAVAFDDDSGVSEGGGGSFSDLDSFLTYTNNTGSTQTYLIEVDAFGSGVIETTDQILLNVSVTGHAATGSAVSVGDDTLNGGDGNDLIYGMGGDDTINGGDGDDVIAGGAGADILDGGAGNDTLDYSASSSRVIVELDLDSASDGDAEGDTITNFENIIGSDFNDTLSLDISSNGYINAGAGNDFFLVFGGSGTYRGEAGDDQIVAQTNFATTGAIFDGGDGTDIFRTNLSGTFDLRDDVLISIETLRIDANAGDASSLLINADQFTMSAVRLEGGHAGGSGELRIFMDSTNLLDLSGVTFTNFVEPGDLVTVIGDGEGEVIIGGDNVRNVINGNGSNDAITGGNLADTLDGGDGGDVVSGGDGDDIINGGAGEDIIAGGAGADMLDGGAGVDTVSYAASNAGVTVVMDGTVSGGHADGDTLSNFENIIGSDFNDALGGNSGNNILSGGSGNDGFRGRIGVDSLYGGDGDDAFQYVVGENDAGEVIDGGAGSDSIQIFGTGFDDFDFRSVSVLDIEQLYFANALGGGARASFNAAQLADVTHITSESLSTGTAQLEIFLDTEAHLDLSGITVTGFGTTGEVLILGNAGNNIITGTNANDRILAGAGNDRLAGGDGDDQFFGEDGADTILGGAGADFIAGGAGFDSVDYRASTSRVVLDLGSSGTVGYAAGDSYNSIERVYATNFNDTITGTNANEFFYGEDGNDTINAGGGIDRVYGGDGNDIQRGQDGNDVLYGSAGNDQLNGGAGFDIASYEFAASRVVLNLGSGGTLGDAAGDSYFGIEVVRGSDFNDIIAGNNSANELRGGDGDDILNGGGGNDRLFGGADADALNGGTGTDIAVYTDAAEAVQLDLAAGGSLGEADGDTFSSIEWVWGSDFNDHITGDGASNRLEGRDGNDFLDGVGGNDRLLGGDGNDTINGGDGIDTIFGQNGNDILSGGAGNDFFFGSDGGDSMDGGADFDTVSYLASSSRVEVNLQTGGTFGDAAGDSYVSIERVLGTSFDDRIYGSNGDDVLIGNGGEDAIYGGQGNDSLIGGAGSDSFAYETINGGADVINDFFNGETIFIYNNDGSFDSFAELQAAASDAGGNVIFDFGGGNTLTVVGRNIADLDSSDFNFLTGSAGQAFKDVGGFEQEPLLSGDFGQTDPQVDLSDFAEFDMIDYGLAG